MRRLALFALLLAALSLSTAVAASFDVQAEDVQTYDTSVSISVPDPITLGPTVYIRGDSHVIPGQLDLVPPAKNDSTTTKLFLLSVEEVQAQTAVDKYFTWQTPAAPPEGYRFEGQVVLTIEQDGPGSDRLTAGLFDCLASVAPDSSDTTDCELITIGVGVPLADNSQGYKERTVDFGVVPDTVIASGRQLRLKIVNRAQQPVGTVVSTGDWNLQWGYLPARKSRLDITPS